MTRTTACTASRVRWRGSTTGGRPNPVVKVHELAWLEFDKPDLDRAELFARAFGFTTAIRGPDELQLRGGDPGSPCVLIRKGPRSRFLGGGVPGGRLGRRAAAGRGDRPEGREAAGERGRRDRRPGRPERAAGAGGVRHARTRRAARAGAADVQLRARSRRGRTRTQRPPRQPAAVQRLGHVVLQTTTYRQTLDWYLQHLGLIVSDFLYYPGQRERGPVMSFIRCDRGATPTDHHTLALALGPPNRYVHSAYEVADLDALAAGGEYLREQGYRRSWGIGRHIQGSQIFDYWRDPDGFLVEHFADGDLFDCTLEPGWAPMTASGLAQWGPPATKDFLGIKPGPQALAELRAIAGALRQDNEFDLRRLRGLLKVATS